MATSESDSAEHEGLIRRRLPYLAGIRNRLDSIRQLAIKRLPLGFFNMRAMNFTFDSMPLTREEIDRAVSNGGSRPVLAEARRLVRRRSAFINLISFLASGLYIYMMTTGALNLQLHLDVILPAMSFLVFISLYAIGYFHLGMGSPRRRLLLHLTRLIHLLTVWDTSGAPQNLLNLIAKREIGLPIVVAKKLRRLAWPIVRDLALWGGAGKSKATSAPWVNIGKALNWISDRTSDPRYRARAWELVAEICLFLSCDNAQPPRLLIGAADKYTVRATHRQELLMIVEIIKAPLLVGIIVAAISAVLRIWFK